MTDHVSLVCLLSNPLASHLSASFASTVTDTLLLTFISYLFVSHDHGIPHMMSGTLVL